VTNNRLVAIEPLHDLTSSSVGELVAESERFGLRLVRRLTEEWTTGANRFDRPGEILFGAFIAGRLVGVCGLNVDPYAGDERVGRVRHLYVLAAFRRRGVGRQLVERVMQAAHGRFDDVRLRTNDPAAARLYETLGFRRSTGHDSYTHVANLTSTSSRPCGSGGP
jgi:GNAT superfamily N-acetyltransferase